MRKKLGIIFAGGSGARMGAGMPKQFLEVDGKAIIIHTLEVFEEHPEIDEIYVACKEEYIPKLEKLVQRHMISKVKNIVPGGDSGQESIYNALMAARKENDDDAVVLIHDGVRPCIERDLVDEVIRVTLDTGAAVVCTPLQETPIVSEDGKKVADMPPRAKMYTAQAPQCFFLGEVLSAHEKVRTRNPEYKGIIDTCTLMKGMGKEISLVEGPRGNIKVTTPEDLYMFRAMLRYRESEQIFGFSKKEVSTRLVK